MKSVLYTQPTELSTNGAAVAGVTHDAIVHIPGVVYIFIDEVRKLRKLFFYLRLNLTSFSPHEFNSLSFQKLNG